MAHFIQQLSTLNAQWSIETDTSMIYGRHGICFHTILIKMKLNRSTVPIPQECHCQKNINSFLRDEYRIVRIVRPCLRYMFPDQTGNACLQGELKSVPNSNGCHFAKYISIWFPYMEFFVLRFVFQQYLLSMIQILVNQLCDKPLYLNR